MAFLEQSLFGPTGFLSVDITSPDPSRLVLTHTVYTDANVSVTLRGSGFLLSNSGEVLTGQITSMEFDGLDVRQGTISGINWSAPAFLNALNAISESSDFAPLAALFNQSSRITLDASGGLTRFDQELAWSPFLPLLTKPITFIGSPFGDSIEGASGNDILQPAGNSDMRDRIVGSAGNDRIVFDISNSDNNAGYWVDYDSFTESLSFNIDSVANAGSIIGESMVDKLENVNDALETSLGLEGTLGDDTYNIRTGQDHLLFLNGNEGSDSYFIDSPGSVVVLDYQFGASGRATSGVDINLGTGAILDDGLGFSETLDVQNAPDALLIFATDEADVIRDGADNQLIRFYSADDTFFAGAGGIDSVDGGAGEDTVVFEQTVQGALSIQFQNGQSIVADRGAPGDLTYLVSVENLQTQGNVVLELDKHDGIGLISAENLTTLTELYIAYFNRAADALGLSFWATAFQKNGFSFEEIADLFFTQPETVALYSDVSDGEFVNAVYNNVLGRNPDQAGFDFWTGQLAAGNVTESGFILDLLAGARAATGSPDDVAYIENKTDIGLYFAVIQGQSDVAAANSVMAAFDGSASSIDAAQALSDAALSDAVAGSSDLLLPVVGVVDSPFALFG
ncbi:DUF4214 domain-containing protein [Marivita geojedonensis]|uniref:DUF4214 domain-containing protein n=1 Tax=Marivita geojedonensis TaxID=1123756 RepID=A0A1X4NP81_9RHOB|nr:DUF4214 domain-containing protein [Marivita geojedonensis]OSQ52515.1 hypothetical protein MGEO_03815 [Marivita geojedonensis]PRY80696.1 uncharacterized protein DUF4214 [Marivita geojedonensis]